MNMCGVVGIIGSPDAAKETFLALITLQHRGQDAAGIISYDQNFHVVKNLGLVESVFNKQSIQSLTGEMAIGHTRYSTAGKGDLNDVQPFLLSHPFGIGIAHNGNIVNYLNIKERLQKEMQRRCLTQSDTETILHWIAHHLKGTDFSSLQDAVKSVFENIHGSYSVAGFLGEGGLFAFRDPYGIRPLVLGKKNIASKDAYIVASETLTLSFLGYEFLRTVLPGELIYIDQTQKLYSKVLMNNKPHRPCMFEWVYFASAESEVENTPVYGVRLELGKALAQHIKKRLQNDNIHIDLVAPVPDTSRTSAIALAEELQLPYREVLIKNRYIKRTFIVGSQGKREEALDLKLHPVRSELLGKSILLVDDSIVRGTTSKKIVQLIRQAGAKKVYFVSTCPPIQYPCFYGIDFPDQNELIASQFLHNPKELESQIAKKLGVDGVFYQSKKGLLESIQVCSQRHSQILHISSVVKNPCTACLDGQYPTDVSESPRLAALRLKDRQNE